jgi:NAD(P)-dependent dehydrogenase (short-subunit alcohol dehydrogenase family)
MPYSGFDITDKSCLVVGGTSGIGRAVALALVESGARVVVGSSNPDKVATMKRELPEPHDAVQIQVADETNVRAAIDHVLKKFGRLDAVINAAGILHRAASLDVSLNDFERIVKTNLTGSFLVARESGRVMKGQPPDAQGLRGSIVMVASLTSFVSLNEVISYAASKSGVLGLVRGLANEWANLGIRVNAIAPGVFPTDINRQVIEGTERGARLLGHTPMNRFGRAEELCGAVIYLISPSASFTTGETIVVDGGFLTKGV